MDANEREQELKFTTETQRTQSFSKIFLRSHSVVSVSLWWNSVLIRVHSRLVFVLLLA